MSKTWRSDAMLMKSEASAKCRPGQILWTDDERLSGGKRTQGRLYRPPAVSKRVVEGVTDGRVQLTIL